MACEQTCTRHPVEVVPAQVCKACLCDHSLLAPPSTLHEVQETFLCDVHAGLRACACGNALQPKSA
eukprot:1309171-Pleurochrysis_carterae.AAC.3